VTRFVFWDTSPEVLAKAAPLYAGIAAIRMQWALLKLARKYRPDQPRVLAGNPNGGQWTDAGGGGGVRVAANGADPLVPNGVYGFPVAHNPLDPANLNPSTMSLPEQQQVADAVNRVNSGMTVGMRGHNYRNRPDPITDAALPSSVEGYRAYDIGPRSGTQRLLVDKGTRQMYYTNNHYKSFWVIVPETKSTGGGWCKKVVYAKS
jgi:hypothetical protein